MIAQFNPPIRIAEIDGRVRLGLDGFRDVEGATLQEAADALVAHLLSVAMALQASCVGPLSSECCADPSIIDFIWKVGEHAQAGGDPRDLLFGSDPSQRKCPSESGPRRAPTRYRVPHIA